MTKRFKEKIVEGGVLYDSLAARLTDMPQLTGDHTALGVLLAQARDLETQQEAAKSQFRDVNTQRRNMAKQATDLRNRLSFGLRSVLGPDSDKLLAFGVKPRPRTIERTRLTPAQKAARAAAKATAKAAALAAAETPPVPPAPPATK
jgi:hypothetical protein